MGGKKINKKGKKHQETTKNVAELRRFDLQDLETATNNFKTCIGEGGFGSVYQGQLDNGQNIAVKRLHWDDDKERQKRGHKEGRKPGHRQGDHEFNVEINISRGLDHPNIIKMIGYHSEKDARHIVYELMPKGSLESCLHEEAMNWNKRLKIAQGIARGLSYLHNEADPPIIHRDVKSSNILLDAQYNPKISDFGLAMIGIREEKTKVMGTPGYCCPEYRRTGILSKKLDVYSYGVVLLEIITGKKALEKTRNGDARYLIDWALPKDRKSKYLPVDAKLNGVFDEETAHDALELVRRCTQVNSHARPDMSQLVTDLSRLVSCQK